MRFWYRGTSVPYAGKIGLALLVSGALWACGSDDDVTGPDPRVRFASTVAASATGCPIVTVTDANKVDHQVQSYNVTATWQASGMWSAVFVRVLDGKILATSDTTANQTKTSVGIDSKGKAYSCLYLKGDLAYVILQPAGATPVNGEADTTPTITVGG